MGERMKGFSLVELMVVIAIVALLAAIAVPSYASYRVKTKVALAHKAILDAQKELIRSYNATGVWPASMSIFGFTIPDSGTGISFGTDVSSNPLAAQLGITSVAYARGGGLGAGAKGVYFHSYLSNSVIGFPSGGPNSLKQGIFVDTAGVTRSYCGVWSTTANGVNDVPAQYMPVSCRCVNMSNIVSFDTAPTGC